MKKWNYYNDSDPKVCAWARELIKAGLVPDGEVDCRSIADINADDLRGFVQCHFFCGILGWSLALRLAGWPDERPVWTGSCPCQPFSDAGLGLGESDERHLWPAFFGLIDAERPSTIFGEQVASKSALAWLDGVFADMEGANYACAAADLCAAGVGAPHIRQRLFWVANSRHASMRRPTRPSEAEGGRAFSSATGCGLAGGLADATDNGCAEYEHESRERRTTGPEYTAERDSAGGLAHAATIRCGQIIENTSRGDEGVDAQGRATGSPMRGATERLGRADSAGRVQQCGTISVPTEQSTAELRGNAWDSFDILPCTDGKARRIESGTFPLAHGVSGRVGLLRGYGNAIVPQVAAHFIQAAAEASNLTLSCPTSTESL